MPDFLFPSGVVAANQIADAAAKAKIAIAQSSPFYTPMVIASWQPVAKILVANGMAKPLGDRTYGVDIAKLTETMLARKRWKDLKGAEAYDVSRGVLVSTTDVRRSNSAAMYLALTSYAKNGDVVTDRAAAEPLARQLAELFKRQGYQENYVNGNFDDYVAIGIGKTPMAFIYEYQLVSLRARQEGHRRRHGADVPAADDRQQGRLHGDQRALARPRRPARQQRRAAEDRRRVRLPHRRHRAPSCRR